MRLPISNHVSLLVLVSVLLISGAAGTAAATEPEVFVYIGTYTGEKSKGIYISRFNVNTGQLSSPELAADTRNPSFLVVHPNQRILYSVGEVSNFGGQRSGAVCSFKIDQVTGKLQLMSQRSSGGTGPCHLVVDRKGKCVLVANYGSGSVAALPISRSGELSEPVSVIQHSGSSVNKARQAGPHAHHAAVDPWNLRALFCDLGLDKVVVYKLDAGKALLTANEPGYATLEAGAGPRHLVFGRDGRTVYVVNEMASSITAFQYSRKSGSLAPFQTISILPTGADTGQTTAAEIQVHPSGKFVYASNRGHDLLAIFSVGERGGLSLIGHESTRGKAPRHFALDPSGKWLLAGNQSSDSIVIFELDGKTGSLSSTGQIVPVASPVCIEFVKPKQVSRN